MTQYNNTLEPLLMKEYGRNIQNIVRHIAQIENKDLQKENIQAMIKIMGQLNSGLKKNEDNLQKIWDHLVLISDFKLADVSPYPLPSKDNIFQKPAESFTYPSYKAKNLHYGRYLEDLTEKCLQEKNPETQKEYIKFLITYIRIIQLNEMKETVSQESIKRDFSRLTLHQFDKMDFIDEYITHVDVNLPKFSPKQHSNSPRRSFRNNNGGKKYGRRNR